MPKNLEELAKMIAKRDSISYNEAWDIVQETEEDLQHAFYNGSLDEVEDILRFNLGVELDYLDLFIY